MVIIAVDDEQGALSLLKNAIEEAIHDAELLTFNSPAAALEEAKTRTIDIAYLDIRMFKMTGLELAEKLKETNPKMNIIFVTGYDEFALDAIQLHASGYVTKPVTAAKIAHQMENLLHPIDEKEEAQENRFEARTFGNFEFFVDGKPLNFPREKSKELLAVLVDQGGAMLTTEQIATLLYEDRFYDRKMKNQLMPVIRALQDTLAEAGASGILIKTWGHLGVDRTKFRCDAYDFLDGDENAVRAYHGEYMANYSWAEERAALFYWKANSDEE